MESFEAEALILAGADTVWDIITDGGNYAVWDSGITEVTGEVGHGARIRVRTRDGGKRTFRLRVCQIPAKLMTWSGALPLGLLQVVRTFTLTDYTGITLLSVRDTASGPLRGLVRKTVPGTYPTLTGYVGAVKFRAELLSFHFEGGVFPGPPLPAAPDDTTGPPQLSGKAR
jgi:hypothetical protein